MGVPDAGSAPAKQLFRSTSAYLSGELGAQGLNILKYKVLALRLGPEGIGLFSLVDSFFQLLIVGVSNGVANGSVQLIGQTARSGDPAAVRREQGRIATGGVVLVALLLCVLAPALWLARAPILAAFLDPKARPYFPIYLVAFPLLCIVPLLNALLQAQLRIKEMAIGRVLIATVDALAIASLVLALALRGWFLGLVISAAAGVLILSVMVGRLRVYRPERISLRHESLRRLLVFFLQISIVLTAVGVGSSYVLRKITLNALGLGAVGLYQSALGFMAYLGLVSRASSIYFFPRVAHATSDAERGDELNRWIVFNLVPVALGAVLLVLFGDLAVRLFFSGRFAGLLPALGWFVLAQVFVVVTTGYQQLAVAIPAMGWHIIGSVTIHASWLICAAVLMPWLGFKALGLAYSIGGVLGLAVYHFALRRRIGLRMRPRTIGLLAVAVLGIAGAAWMRVQVLPVRFAYFVLMGLTAYRMLEVGTRASLALAWSRAMGELRTLWDQGGR